MDLRLRNLEQLDSRAVPLPHGTEVVTRVDRIVGERRVPQGSVGRVTKIDGDDLDVTIVGVGVVRYARGEVSPRRVGQVLFAHRRADAWETLSGPFRGQCREGRRERPKLVEELRLDHQHRPAIEPLRQPRPAEARRLNLNSPNRRMRTRTSGGVGGA
jgi:hypothetical protein